MYRYQKEIPKKMAIRYRFGDSKFPHFITFAVINWIDALRRALYKNPCSKPCDFYIKVRQT
jgi:putative transposase